MKFARAVATALVFGAVAASSYRAQSAPSWLSAVAGGDGAGARQRPTWVFTSKVAPIPVTDSLGKPVTEPFLGGFDVPRPQLVDIDGDGDLDLFVQERSNDIMFFERADGKWVLRTERYQDLAVGEWFRFVDVDHDGKLDLLGEMLTGYIKLWRNVGTTTQARFQALPDSIRDTDGKAVLADRQNILNAADIDCNGKLDLFIGRTQGVVDRFEEEGKSPDGAPRFQFHTANWEGIEIIGPEAAAMMGLPMDSMPEGPSDRATAKMARHGANTLTFADIDRDGDLDLFWGDFFEAGLLLIENVGTCPQPNLRVKPTRFPVAAPLLTSGYNAPTFGDVDGDGNLDLLVGVIGGAYGPNRTSVDNMYLLRQAPKDTWTVETKRLIPMIDVGSESAPALADIDGDGDLDLLVGNRMSPINTGTSIITWFENVGTKTAPALKERGSLPIIGEFNYTPTVADLDGDGLKDLVVGMFRDRVHYYRNTGTASVPKWTLADSTLVIITRGSNTTPSLGDIDGDGLIDLVIGEGSGTINLYKNIGTKTAPKFQLVSDNFQEIRPGRRSAPLLVDMDGDGKLDLLIGCETGEVELWRNVGKAVGEFKFEKDPSFVLKSHPNALPAAGDLRGTGKMDLLMGAFAGGLRWLENESRP